jgi:hypothetical protein
MQEHASKIIAETERDIEKLLNKSSALLDIWARFQGKPTAAEIARQRVRELQEDYKTLRMFEWAIQPLYNEAMKNVRLIK